MDARAIHSEVERASSSRRGMMRQNKETINYSTAAKVTALNSRQVKWYISTGWPWCSVDFDLVYSFVCPINFAGAYEIWEEIARQHQVQCQTIMVSPCNSGMHVSSLCRCKRAGMVNGQTSIMFKLKPPKSSVKPPWSPCYSVRHVSPPRSRRKIPSKHLRPPQLCIINSSSGIYTTTRHVWASEGKARLSDSGKAM